MRINTNVSALNTQRILGQTNAAVSKSIGRLSSGFRINRAADDAAGLGIANQMRADIRAMKQAGRNAEQANSVLQIMEGATGQVQNILERMKELAAQAASDSVDGDASSGGRKQINDEFTTLREELNRIVSTTNFQGTTLLDGSFGSTASVATGGTDLGDAAGITVTATGKFAADANFTASIDRANDTMTLTNDATNEAQTVAVNWGSANSLAFDSLGITVALESTVTEDAVDDGAGAGFIGASSNHQVGITATNTGGQFLVSASGDYSGDDLVSLDAVDLQASAIGSGAGSQLSDIADLGSTTNAQSALTVIDDAISDVADALGTIGAAQNRIEFATANINSAVENFAAAESTIRDADMAAEMTELSRQQILQQAGTAMLAQANQAPQGVLQLLR